MTAWGWVGLALAWALSMLVAWWRGRSRGAGDLDRVHAEALMAGKEYGMRHGAGEGYEAGTRAAATATRATIADAVSLLPSLRCGGGHADHVRRTDVQRIVAGEPIND